MAARPETLQQFEDAFEELYRRSPMPQLHKSVRSVPPLLFSRQSPMPLIPRQDGTKVKAIFDMMKWKNCSMSSELNTSVATSTSACGGDNDTSSNVGVMVQKEKENLTPEKATDGLSNLSGQRRQVEVFLSGTSPQASDSRDTLNDSQGDQETLQLVSKLVERLHSSNDKDSDRDDDWDVTDSCNAQASSPVTTWPREDSVSVVQVLDRGPKSRSTGNRCVELRSGKNAPSENVTNAATSAKIDNSAASAKNGAAGNNSVIAAMLKVVGNKTAENNSRKTPENHTTEDANDREVCNRNRPTRQGARTFDKEKIPQEIRSQKSAKTSTNQSESQRDKSTSSNTTTLRLRRKRGASIIEDSSADEIVIEATTEKQKSLKRKNSIIEDSSADEVVIKATTEKQKSLKRKNSIIEDSSADEVVIKATTEKQKSLKKKNSIMEDSSADEVVIEATTEKQTSLKRKNGIREDSSADEVVIKATTEKQTSLKRKNGIREDSSDSEITITAKTKKQKSLKRKNSIMEDSSDDEVTITAKTEKQKSLKRKNSIMEDSSDDEITKRETTEKRTSLKRKTSIMVDSSDHGEVTKTTMEKQRPLKRRTSIIEDSSENEEAVKNAAREKRRHGIERYDQAADEAMDSDVIHMQTRSHMTDRKDPFSLDSSGNEDVMEVENDVILYASQKSQDVILYASQKSQQDVILYASQKSQDPKPTRRNEQKRSVSKVTRSRANAAKEEIHLDKQTKEDKQKVLKLHSWSLQPIPWMKSVRIEGKLPNSDYFWLSSVIVERVTNRLLKSTNGSLYRLVGNISVHNTKAAGFPRELIRLFRLGFPTDWKELIESSFAASNEMNTSSEPEPASKDGKPAKTKTEVPTHPPRSLEATSVSNTLSKSRDPSQIQTQGKPTDKDAETCQEDAASTNAEPRRASRGALKRTGLKQKPERLSTPPQQRRLDPRSFLTPDQQKKDLEESTAIWTPQGVMSRALEAKAVSRTKSGRAVIPPLARWAGQYCQRDADGNVTLGFASLAAEQHFAKIAEREMGAPLKLRNSPMVAGTKSKAGKMKKPVTHEKEASKNINVQPKASTSRKDKSEDPPTKTTAGMKLSGKDENMETGVENGEHCIDLCVDDMTKDVMALLQKSKERRMRTVTKRATCYSVMSQAKGKGPALSQSLEYSEDEEGENADEVPNRVEKRTTSVPTKQSVDAREKAGGESRVQGSKDSAQQRLCDREQKTTDSELAGSRKRLRDRSCTQNKQNDTCEFPSKERPRNVHSRSNGDVEKYQSKQGSDSSNVSHNRKLSENVSDDEENSFQEQIPEKRKTQSNTKKSVQPNPTNRRVGSSAESNSRKTANTKDDSILSMSTTNMASRRSTRLRSSSESMTSVYAHQKNDQEIDSDDSDLSRSISDFEKEAEAKQKWDRRNLRSSSKDSGCRKGHGEERQKGGRREEHEGGERPWSKEEIRKLHEATQKINSDDPHFWEVVSQHVETRSTKECAAHHLQDKPDNKNRGNQKEPKQDDKTPSLHGKRGTLKRRRELRAMLEHDSNNNDQDDLFCGTPFGNTKKAKVPCVDFSKTDEEVFGRNPNFFTPKQDGSREVGILISHTPVSSRKTPSVYTTHSPWQDNDTAKKRDIDQYVFRLKKNKKKLTRSSQKKKMQKLAEEAASIKPPSVRLFGQSAAPEGLFQISEEKSCDDEKEEDYYYSDSEN